GEVLDAAAAAQRHRIQAVDAVDRQGGRGGGDGDVVISAPRVEGGDGCREDRPFDVKGVAAAAALDGQGTQDGTGDVGRGQAADAAAGQGGGAACGVDRVVQGRRRETACGVGDGRGGGDALDAAAAADVDRVRAADAFDRQGRRDRLDQDRVAAGAA